MPYNGSGVYTPPGTSFPAVANTLIESTKFNNVINDIAAALSGVITKDGQTTITANLSMAGFRLTTMADAVARSDAATLGQVQDGQAVYGGTAGGTANALTLTLNPAVTAKQAGRRIYFKVGAAANTGPATLAVNGLSAGALQNNGAALAAGELEANKFYCALEDGTNYQIYKIALPAAVTGALLAANNLSDVASAATSFSNIKQAATTTATGVVELLTQAEYDAGTDTTRAPTASLNRIALGTEQTSAAGTAIDFTGIPSGTRRIHIGLVGVSTNGTSNFLVQLGDSGGVETSGYVSGAFSNATAAQSTAGFIITESRAAADITHGLITIVLEDSSDNTWVESGIVHSSGTNVGGASSGSKALSAVLDRVRFTTVAGDTFDAGVINITYER